MIEKHIAGKTKWIKAETERIRKEQEALDKYKEGYIDARKLTHIHGKVKEHREDSITRLRREITS